MTSFSYPPNISYWEIKQYLQDIDLLIVGSGIVGLSTGIFYKKEHPDKRVLIVEKGILPAGASTKNAGFACFGSPSEILADLNHSSEDEVFEIIRKRVDGLTELRKLVGDKNLCFDACGGYEIFRDGDDSLFEKCSAFVPKVNQELTERLGLEHTYTISDNEISGFGLSGVKHLIRNNHEGAIDTGSMMNYLLKMASGLGIMVLNGMELNDFTSGSGKVEVSFSTNLTFKCRKLHIATNGFAHSLLPKLEVKPARAQVLITSEIDDLKLNGTFHMNEGFYYFRNVGNRVLLGGGRELDLIGETTTSLETSELIQSKLDEVLKTIILSDSDYQVDHRWAGVMGVGPVKKTIVQQISENVSCSVRLGGMGVAIGTSIGKESAVLIG